MRRAWVIAAIAILAVLLLVSAGYYYLVVMKDDETIGYSSQDLVVPWASTLSAVNSSLPNGTTSVPIAVEETNLYWNITEDIYAGYGGALDLWVENNNPGKLFIYSFGLKWVSGGSSSYYRNCSATIEPGDRAELGLLIFGAPATGSAEYQIIIKAAVANLAGTQWYDAGALPSNSNSVTITSLATPREQEVQYNVEQYYNRINERVDYSVVSSPVAAIRAAYPGNYSVLQIAEAFTWMRENIEYVNEGSEDYWKTAQETLSSREGDCEDHAILLCSIIGALGGNARVNLIEEHAFPTVFVASTYADLLKVRASLASYYGLDASVFRMAYLQDRNGYWLVIDPTGFPYAGGLPAQSEPTSTSGSWTLLSSYLIALDATGRTYSRGLLDIL